MNEKELYNRLAELSCRLQVKEASEEELNEAEGIVKKLQQFKKVRENAHWLVQDLPQEDREVADCNRLIQKADAALHQEGQLK